MGRVWVPAPHDHERPGLVGLELCSGPRAVAAPANADTNQHEGNKDSNTCASSYPDDGSHGEAGFRLTCSGNLREMKGEKSQCLCKKGSLVCINTGNTSHPSTYSAECYNVTMSDVQTTEEQRRIINFVLLVASFLGSLLPLYCRLLHHTQDEARLSVGRV